MRRVPVQPLPGSRQTAPPWAVDHHLSVQDLHSEVPEGLPLPAPSEHVRSRHQDDAPPAARLEVRVVWLHRRVRRGQAPKGRPVAPQPVDRDLLASVRRAAQLGPILVDGPGQGAQARPEPPVTIPLIRESGTAGSKAAVPSLQGKVDRP